MNTNISPPPPKYHQLNSFVILKTIKMSSAKEKFFVLYYTGRKLKQITKFKLEL